MTNFRKKSTLVAYFIIFKLKFLNLHPLTPHSFFSPTINLFTILFYDLKFYLFKKVPLFCSKKKDAIELRALDSSNLKIIQNYIRVRVQN